jgi:hypothetical protein
MDIGRRFAGVRIDFNADRIVRTGDRFVADIRGESKLLHLSVTANVQEHGDKGCIVDADAHLFARRDEMKAVRILAQDRGKQAHEFAPGKRRALMVPGAVARNANVDVAAMGRVPALDRRQRSARRSIALQARKTNGKSVRTCHSWNR